MDKHVKRPNFIELQLDWVLEQQPTYLQLVPDSLELFHYVASNQCADDTCEVNQ